jgi:thymidylate synthase
MFVIRCDSIGRGHELAVKKIIRDGGYLVTEDGEETLELKEPLNIHCSRPMTEPRIGAQCTFGPQAMEQYVRDLLEGTTGEFTYTYHDRLFGYPVTVSAFGDKGVKFAALDQINEVIVMLNKEPNTRRAQAITWVPQADLRSKAPPCLQRIQFLRRHGQLNMYVEFRSRDVLSAMGPNMYALTRLQEMVAKALGIKVGWYSDTSVSAHIYFARDISELTKYYDPFTTHEELVHELRTHIGN